MRRSSPRAESCAGVRKHGPDGRAAAGGGHVRTRLVGPVIVGAIVAAVALASCSGGSDGTAERPFEPTLPHVDFRPKLVLTVTDDAVHVSAGERTDPAVRVDPPSVPSGSVVEVGNDGTREHRLRGGTAFDTGIMRPGERTTVVLTNAGAEPMVIALIDVDTGAPRGSVRVDPAAGES